MIFCVEDEANIRELVVYTLETTGFEARGFEEGTSFFEALAEELPELILLDIMLPGEDGMEILKKLKTSGRTKDIPVIMVTAKGAEYDKVMGLDAGADDYVTKPFTPLELLARVNSQLRRYSRYLEKLKDGGSKEEEQHIYRIGGLELNEEKVELRVDGVPVKVTPMEYRILLLLMKHPGRVFSSDEIYERVWNEKAVNSDTIMVHVRNIREKIEINPKNPKYLKVVWGVGYKMEKQ